MSDVDVWVSAEFERLAQIINDYDPSLFLEMVPAEAQQMLNDKTKVFRIIDDRTRSIVLYADSLTNPQEILTRLWSMDNGKENVLKRMDAANAAQQALQLASRMDDRLEAMDLTAFVLKNTKSRWEHNGKIYDDQFRQLGPKSTVID